MKLELFCKCGVVFRKRIKCSEANLIMIQFRRDHLGPNCKYMTARQYARMVELQEQKKEI